MDGERKGGRMGRARNREGWFCERVCSVVCESVAVLGRGDDGSPREVP